jgi:methylaspartate ammonia-lyase
MIARDFDPNMTMDDKSKRGPQDRARTNLRQDYEVRDWAKSLGVDEHELRNAVSAVGDSGDKVREYLAERSQRKRPHRAGYLRQQRKRISVAGIEGE